MARAQDNSGGPAPRFITALGTGNTFGGLGVLVEAGPPGHILTVVGAIGYSRALFDSEPSGAAGAIGARAYARASHRGLFGEIAFLEVAKDVVRDETGDRVAALYGPGAHVGYRFGLRDSSLVIDALIGAGYVVHAGLLSSRWKPIFGLGIGYVWPHR